MSFIEGIGDEVTAFFVILIVIALATLFTFIGNGYSNRLYSTSPIRTRPEETQQVKKGFAEFELVESCAQNNSFNSDSSIVQGVLRGESIQNSLEAAGYKEDDGIRHSVLVEEAQVTMKEVAAVTEASNQLGINLYCLLVKESTNVFFSPFSLSTALAMLFCGARNETAEEMRKVLGYEVANIKDGEIKLCFQKLLDAMDSNQEYYTLNYANTVLSDKVFSAKEEYKSLVEHFFKAFFMEVDFVNERGDNVKLVNEWVKKKTNNMIPKVLDSLDPLIMLIILNAVYFKGYWLVPFLKENTKPQDFCIKGDKNNCKQADMMHSFLQRYLYTEMESYKALELPYKGNDISMLILLPDSEDGLSELENSLSSTFIQDIKQSMTETRVHEVALPKFKLEYSKSLKREFQSLGLNRVFSGGAHLNGINDSNELFLSEVNHAAILEVNEEGSEAVAVSYPLLGGGTGPVKLTKFIVDHPFMFLIYNTKNNLILFMGRVEEL